MEICSVSHLFFHIYSASSSPHLKSKVYKIKNCCSTWTPFSNESSSRLSSSPFRTTKGGEMLQLSMLRSHSSLMALKCIIMQMWILILNFKKRLFLLQTNKKRSHVVSIASLSCKQIVNYAFGKRCFGGGRESPAKLLKLFLCPLNS